MTEINSNNKSDKKPYHKPFQLNLKYHNCPVCRVSFQSGSEMSQMTAVTETRAMLESLTLKNNPFEALIFCAAQIANQAQASVTFQGKEAVVAAIQTVMVAGAHDPSVVQPAMLTSFFESGLKMVQAKRAGERTKPPVAILRIASDKVLNILGMGAQISKTIWLEIAEAAIVGVILFLDRDAFTMKDYLDMFCVSAAARHCCGYRYVAHHRRVKQEIIRVVDNEMTSMFAIPKVNS